jgi:orotate phosphoribosyltransferase-like protein
VARAFQGYVEDMVAAKGGKSPFLNHAPENSAILTPWGLKRPYPAGAERKAMNAAFDAFVREIKTKETEQGTAMFSRRSANGNRLPDVVIGHKLGTLSNHPDYAAAKAGDTKAALRIAVEMVDDAMVDTVKRSANGADVIVPVVSIEATGRNKIPLAVAEILADRLGSTVELRIVQADSPKRTGMDGLSRLLNPPVFDGPVQRGVAYVLVDDTVTQGGTFASLASHIRDNGGEVSAVVALTGKQYSAKLALNPELLSQVREHFQSVEPQFQAATGYGFDALTESEARYLAKHNSPQSIRDRIIAAGNAASIGANEGNTRFSKDALENRTGLISPQVQSIVDATTVAALQTAIKEFTGQTASNQLGRIVATTASEIKSTWEPLVGRVNLESEGEAGAAQAFFDPTTKTVFLIADNIAAGTEQAVLAHELMHKHGQAVLGEAGWNKLHGVISTWQQAQAGTPERAVYDYAAEIEARAARRGLWADANPMPPWVFRHKVKREPKPPLFQVVWNQVCLALRRSEIAPIRPRPASIMA